MVKRIVNILSIIILVVLVFVVLNATLQRFMGKPPTFFGYGVFRVSSASMEPDLMVGDVILSKEVPAEELQAGDVVTYYGTQGDVKGKIITHKVTAKPYKENDVYYIQTQGIAIGAPPDPVIQESQLLGKMVMIIPLLNYLYDFFLTPFGLIVILLLVFFIFSGDVIRLIRLYGRKRKQTSAGQFSDGEWEAILQQAKAEEGEQKAKESQEETKEQNPQRVLDSAQRQEFTEEQKPVEEKEPIQALEQDIPVDLESEQ